MSIYMFTVPGWDELSTWGFDEGIGSFYAQLTRNGNGDDNGPEIWITPGPGTPSMSTRVELAQVIAKRTGLAVNTVHEALDESV